MTDSPLRTQSKSPPFHIEKNTLKWTIRGDKHIIQTPEKALAKSEAVLTAAKEAGVVMCEVYNKTDRKLYRVPLDTFFGPLARVLQYPGYEPQRAVPLQYWETSPVPKPKTGRKQP